MSNTKIVTFKGIERVNKGVNCNQNACEEIINLRPQGNCWEKIRPKGRTNIGFRLYSTDYSVYEHGVNKDLFVFVFDKENNKIIKYRKDNSFTEEYSYNNETILSLSFLGNIMTICTDKKKRYYIYKDDTKTYSELTFDCSIDIKCSGIRDGGNSPKFITEYKDARQEFPRDNNISKDEQSLIDAFLNKRVEEDKAYKLFSGASFYRVALKLFDGRYINYSTIGYADTNGDNLDNGTGAATFTLPITYFVDNFSTYNEAMIASVSYSGTHKVQLYLSNVSMLKNLMENKIVDSIELYMTRPASRYEAKKKITKEFNIPGIYIVNYQYFCKRDIEQIKDSFYNGVYYFVKSWGINDINDLSEQNNMLELNVNSDTIQALEGNKTLPTPNIDAEVMYQNCYNYNNMQHLYGLIYSPFQGYDFPNSGTSGVKYTCVIETKFNDKQIVVRKDFFNNGHIANSRIKLPKLYCYPTIDNVNFRVVQNNNIHDIILFGDNYNKPIIMQNLMPICDLIEDSDLDNDNVLYSLKIKASDSTNDRPNNTIKNQTVRLYNTDVHIFLYGDEQNISFFKERNVPIQAIFRNKIQATKFIADTNILQLTAMNNPFVLPSEYNYSVGDKANKIIALTAMNLGVSEYNFGKSPMYVLSSEGIFVFSVGEGDIAYSTQNKIGNYTIINPNVLEFENSFIFVSDAGLMMFSNGSMRCLSNFVKGTTEYSNNTINLLGGIVNSNKLTPANIDFLDEIKNAVFYFYPRFREVNIVTDKYTYVYSLDYDCFYKREDRYIPIANNTNSEYLVKYPKDNANGYFGLYELKEDEQSNFDTIAILTKPFNLDTRQYKKIKRLIVGASVKKTRQVSFVLLGSDDCLNFHIVKQQVISPNEDLSEIYLSRALRSFKYGVIGIMSNRISDTYISGVAFEFDIVRAKDGIL